ncbi:hypothetical protein [Caulobacter sp.]|uniref:hypothetical protein n=1 Tax=Caulobacter sp. TaxID=78 RepID=UPI001AFE75CC|nr:hypothetical protein [Caulobacter sp.]MBO9547064.1 hypothetical protein [Caulobacter sp.]
MRRGPPPTARERRIWFDLSVGIGLLGALLAIGGLRYGGVVMIVGGAVAASLAAVAITLHLRLGDGPFRTRAARSRRMRVKLATWAAVAPLGLAILSLAFRTGAPETIHLSGKPVEVRADSRRVFMPDGASYVFTCGEGRSRRTDCPALAKWAALPRWPEPEHVEMEVYGSRIMALRMDGQVIVDLKADNDDKGMRVMFVLAGLALVCGAIVGFWRSVRQLAALKPSGKRDRRAAKGSPTPPASL